MDVLVFGGSFDPPHACHLKMLKAGLAKIKPAAAYVVPAFHSPLKGPARLPAKERLVLARLALRDGLTARERAGTRLCDFEIARGRTTYTYEVLRFIAGRHPGARLHFLLGSDAAMGFRNWKRASEIRSACRFLIARRPEVDFRAHAAGLPPCSVLPGLFPRISSTEIRARLLVRGDAEGLVSERTLKRIRAKRHYGLKLRAQVRAMLKDDRFAHTLAVAEMALELALRHRVDVELAALAGLLHDCGRGVPVEEMPRYIRDNRIDVPLGAQIARRQPLLFHAHISADLARRRLGIEDPAVLSAIRKHTLGDVYMSDLDRVIYAADACSRDRAFPEAARIRRKALKSLPDGLREALRAKLSYILRLDGWIHSSGIALWNGLVDDK